MKNTQHYVFGQFRNNTQHSVIRQFRKNTEHSVFGQFRKRNKTFRVWIVYKSTKHSLFGQFRKNTQHYVFGQFGKTHNILCLDSLGKETKHSGFGQFRKRNNTFRVWIVQEKRTTFLIFLFVVNLGNILCFDTTVHVWNLLMKKNTLPCLVMGYAHRTGFRAVVVHGHPPLLHK